MAEIHEMERGQLAIEVAYWREDAASRILCLRTIAEAAIKAGLEDTARAVLATYLRPTVEALRDALQGRYDEPECQACGLAVEDGQAVYAATDGGMIHATCVGTPSTAEGFTDPDGKPLPADAAIPTPHVHEREFTPERIRYVVDFAEALLKQVGV